MHKDALSMELEFALALRREEICKKANWNMLDPAIDQFRKVHDELRALIEAPPPKHTMCENCLDDLEDYVWVYCDKCWQKVCADLKKARSVGIRLGDEESGYYDPQKIPSVLIENFEMAVNKEAGRRLASLPEDEHRPTVTKNEVAMAFGNIYEGLWVSSRALEDWLKSKGVNVEEAHVNSKVDERRRV